MRVFLQEPEKDDDRNNRHGERDALRDLDRETLRQPGHFLEIPRLDEEPRAIVEPLVIDTDHKADDAVHDEHDADRCDHKDHPRTALRAEEAIDVSVGQQHDARCHHDAQRQNEQRCRDRIGRYPHTLQAPKRPES